MRYVTLADVRSAMPQVPITAASKPNEAQIVEFIDETEAYVDAVLSTIGYTTPVTGDVALRIVRQIVMAGVFAKTLNARDLGVRDPEIGGGAHQQRKFDRMIERLQDRKDALVLHDATPPTTKRPVLSRSNAGDEDAREPTFVIGQEF